MRPPAEDRRWLALAALALGASCATSAPTPNCRTQVTVSVAPATAKVGATLVATGTFPAAGRAWSRDWTVTRAGGGSAVPYRARDRDETTIEVTASEAGSYTFVLEIASGGERCRGSASATVTPSSAKSVAYRLRVTPPVASGLPRQERAIVIFGGTPLDGQEVSLAAGLPVAATLTDGKGGAAPGTVRFLAASGLDVLAASGPDGAFAATLLADERYRVLLVPEGAGLAPRLLAEQLGAVHAAGAFTLLEGALVSGTVRDGGGQPIPGARVALRAGDLPSGVGLTGAQGDFALRAAPDATYALTVQADGRPEIRVPAVPVKAGARLDVGGWRAGSHVVAAKVVASDGTSAAPAARVTVRSVAAIPGVATLALDGKPPVDLDGAVDLTLVAGQDGSLPALDLPAGDYRVLIEPPPGSPDGITAEARQLPGPAAWTLTLRPRVRVQGRVTDDRGAAVAGVRVTALARGYGAPPAAITDGQGAFALSIDEAVPVELSYDPPPSGERRLRRAHRTLAPGQRNGDVRLAEGLLLGGTLRPQAGDPLAGARIEAYCAACGDPHPAGIALSGSDGGFVLYLPDPGF